MGRRCSVADHPMDACLLLMAEVTVRAKEVGFTDSQINTAMLLNAAALSVANDCSEDGFADIARGAFRRMRQAAEEAKVSGG